MTRPRVGSGFTGAAELSACSGVGGSQGVKPCEGRAFGTGERAGEQGTSERAKGMKDWTGFPCRERSGGEVSSSSSWCSSGPERPPDRRVAAGAVQAGAGAQHQAGRAPSKPAGAEQPGVQGRGLGGSEKRQLGPRSSPGALAP